MRVPGIVHADSIPGVQTEVDGRWVAARPLPYHTIWQRWRAAWLVFSGRADAVLWHKQ